MELNLKRIRKDLNSVIANHTAKIEHAKKTLAMLDTLEGVSGKLTPVSTRTTPPAGRVGMSAAVRKVIAGAADTGCLIGEIKDRAMAMKPWTKSENPKATIATLVSIMLTRKEITRKKTTEGWRYFSKPAKTPVAKAAA